MSELVNPYTGELLDYEPQAGTPPPSRFLRPRAWRWGRRKLFVVNQNGRGNSETATMIDIRTLPSAVPIDIQLRFALPDTNGSPILPFNPAWPFGVGAAESLQVQIQRAVDQASDVTVDNYIVQRLALPLGGFPSNTTGPVLAVDIVTTRTLRVDCTFSIGLVPDAVWVEAIATPVHYIGRANEIPGWGKAVGPPSGGSGGGFVASTPVGNRVLLNARADRRQFFIVNTSTDGDLILNLSDTVAASWGPPPVGSIVLPRNGFFTYESPVGGYTGTVQGIWTAGTTTGGALVTEGAVFN